MAKCIVFGGGGFIGSHLVDELVRSGHEVTCFDRPTDNRPTYESQGVNRLFGDFMNDADVGNALDGQEYVFHLVSTTTPATAEEDPDFDVETNVLASIRLLQQCVNKGTKRVIFASTGGAIYGDQDKASLAETDITMPVSPYAIGKLTIENYLRFFKKKHKLDYAVFRISNPYGTRQNPVRKQGVIPIFLRNIAEGKPITVIGDGSMVRDYIYVEDVVSMVCSTLERDCQYDTYNIGSGKGESIASIIGLIEQVTGRNVQKDHKEKPATFVDHVTLNTTRFKSEFGIVPQTTLEDGIRKTWEEIVRQNG